jgi:hypothetical protein
VSISQSDLGVTYSLDQADADIAEHDRQLSVMGEAFTQGDATDSPTNPVTGHIQYSTAGHQKYASADGMEYNTGRYTQVTTGTTLINSTSPITVISFPSVAAGTYRAHGTIYAQVAGSGTTQKYQTRYNGTSAVSSMLMFTMSIIESNAVTPGFGITSSYGTDESNSFPSNPPTSSHVMWIVNGSLTISTPGTLTFSLRCNTSGADASCTTQAGSFLELMPVT